MSRRSTLAALACPVLLLAFSAVVPAPLSARTARAQVPEVAAAGAEPLDAFGEEIAVDVVGLPVWVSDREGRPVTGLDRGDFVVLQDGEPVEIVNFAVVDAAGGPEAGAGEAGAPGGFEILDLPSLGEEDTVHVAILVDNWNLRPEDRARVFRGLRDFLDRHVRPSDRIALMVHDRSVRLVQPFSDDGAELGRALDRIEKIAPSATTLDSEREDAIHGIEQAFMGYFDGSGDPEIACQLSAGWGYMENAARTYATAVQAHARVSATAVATAAHALTGLPGHRVLLYVGGGMPQTAGIEVFQLLGEICPSRLSELGYFHLDYDLTWLYQEVAARANAAGVTLFALEGSSPAVDLGLDGRLSGGAVSSAPIRGTIAGPDRSQGIAHGPGFRPSVAAQRQRSLDEEGSLVLLARETGGRAFLNAPEFAGDFGRIARDLRSYYSLGFRPPHPGDGELHRLEVRLVGKEGYRVRHRRAYLDKPAEQLIAERVIAVAQFGGGANPLDVRLEIGDAVPVNGSSRVPVRIWVPLARLTLVPGDEEGTLLGSLHVVMAATRAGGDLGPLREKRVPVTVRPGDEGVAGDQLVEVDVELPPGRHRVALAVRDGLGSETSYLEHGFQVPEPALATADGGR